MHAALCSVQSPNLPTRAGIDGAQGRESTTREPNSDPQSFNPQSVQSLNLGVRKPKQAAQPHVHMP
eukprot:4973648-Alexandrium_andersonii.AAC.1